MSDRGGAAAHEVQNMTTEENRLADIVPELNALLGEFSAQDLVRELWARGAVVEEIVSTVVRKHSVRSEETLSQLRSSMMDRLDPTMGSVVEHRIPHITDQVVATMRFMRLTTQSWPPPVPVKP